jgi:hypothetical protein
LGLPVYLDKPEFWATQYNNIIVQKFYEFD